MTYSFNIKNVDNKKAMKLYKKTNIIGFSDAHKGMIHTVVGIITFLVSTKLFDGHSLLHVCFSIAVACFLYSLLLSVLDINGTYKKLSRALDCPVYVKEIDFMTSLENDEEIDGISIPTLGVKYDVDSSDGRIAILLKTSEESYKILSIINNEEIGKNKVTKVPSIKLKQALSEIDLTSYVCLCVCEITSNKAEGDYIQDSEIDMRSIVTEAFYVERA